MQVFRPLSSRAGEGFALPAVLAVTGVVTLIFLVAITALASLTAEAASARARISFLERALSAEAQLSLFALTEPFSSNSLNVGSPRQGNDFLGQSAGSVSGRSVSPLRLDGRPYSLDMDAGRLIIRTQDQAGLINLMRLEGSALERLAFAVGLSPGEARTISPRLIDYTDVDDLEQPNGAERRAYGGSGPANRALLRPGEWLSLLDVRDAVDPVRWRALKADLAADTTEASLNVNTATPNALQILYGLTPSQVDTAVRLREATPFVSLDGFIAATGASIVADPLAIYTYPSGRIIMTVTDSTSRWTYRSRLVVTPGSPEKPLWIDQSELSETTESNARDATSPAFPSPSR